MAPQPPAPAGAGRSEHQVYRGRAQVPQRHRPQLGDTADLPVVMPLPATLAPRPGARQVAQPGELPRGLVVRRRWRRLRAGAGWSWAGLTMVVICWGIWAISVRGTDVVGPVLGLGLVLAIAGLLFVVAQLIGRAVLERALRRERTGAWPSHLLVCGFLTLAGITFLQQTWWVRDTWRWLADSWAWLGDTWDRLTGLWPL